ncbi:hypothetical protein OFM36_38450, partial [Escherichia coli]|nr:hypothetical protein [Escherichia coli]
LDFCTQLFNFFVNFFFFLVHIPMPDPVQFLPGTYKSIGENDELRAPEPENIFPFDNIWSECLG